MIKPSMSSSSDDDSVVVATSSQSTRPSHRFVPAHRQLHRVSRASLSAKASDIDSKLDSVTKGLKATNIGIDSLTSLGIANPSPAAAADDTADSKSVTATVPVATPEPAPLISLVQFDALVAAELTKIHPSAIGLMHPQRHFRAAVYAYLVKEMYGDDPAGFAIIDMRVDLALADVAPEWVIKVHPALGNVDNHFHVKYTKIRNEVCDYHLVNGVASF